MKWKKSSRAWKCGSIEWKGSSTGWKTVCSVAAGLVLSACMGRAETLVLATGEVINEGLTRLSGPLWKLERANGSAELIHWDDLSERTQEEKGVQVTRADGKRVWVTNAQVTEEGRLEGELVDGQQVGYWQGDLARVSVLDLEDRGMMVKVKPWSPPKRPAREIPPKPDDAKVVRNSLWDGSVREVVDYVRARADDPRSVEFVKWGQVREVPGGYSVWANFRVRNRIGLPVLMKAFFVMDWYGDVVEVIELE